MPEMIKKTDGEMISLHQISEIEFESREMGTEVTIKQWLQELLCRVWVEQDDFSGKKAFGDSNWSWDIYETLYTNRIIDGSMNEYEGLDLTRVQFEIADKIILDIIVEVL